MKHLLTTSLIILPALAQATSQIYTGFNYGAFWGIESNAKKKSDFLDGFLLAKNLTTSVPFDSARLFTCKAAGTLNDPTEAFDAAIDSRTNLLLGFRVSPAEKGGSPDENVKNEMAALEKGFDKHGQALADLIIGLSVGSEDIHRAEDAGGIGVTAEVVSQTIDQVRKSIATSSFAQYMKDKPIGHVDTAKHAVVENADFIGMTVYPYWNNDGIDTAGASFQGSLQDVQQRAGNRLVWIAEMGWPIADSEQHGAAVAGMNELQRFWTEVACTVFGKYTTFWYELLKDSTPDQKADWGLIDVASRKPRIEDLGCGALGQSPAASSQVLKQTGSSSASVMAASSNVPLSLVAPASSESQQQQNPGPSRVIPSPSNLDSRITYITITKTTTITPEPTNFTFSNNPSFITVTSTETSITTITTQPSIPTISNADNPLSSAVSACSSASACAKGTLPAPSSQSSFRPADTTPAANSPKPTNALSTTTVQTTQTTTVFAPFIPANRAWCVTVVDVHRNNSPIPVATNLAGEDGKCSDPPTFWRWPYGTSTT